MRVVHADFARELEMETLELKAQLRRYGIPIPRLPAVQNAYGFANMMMENLGRGPLTADEINKERGATYHIEIIDGKQVKVSDSETRCRHGISGCTGGNECTSDHA